MAPKKKPAKKLTYEERSDRVARQRRRRPVFRRALMASQAVLVFAFLGALAWMGWTKQFEAAGAAIENAFFRSTSALGLNLENVFVTGSLHIPDDVIIATLMPKEEHPPQPYPLFRLSIPKMKERLKSLGWVEEAGIERQLPNTLHITIRERVPAVIWQHGGRFTLVDRNGASISDRDVKLYPRLPVIVGEDAPRNLAPLYTLLKSSPDIMKQLQSLVRVSGRRWNILLKNGVEIKLPEEDTAQAWDTLLSLQRKKQILDRAVKVIDLRDAERVYVLPDTPPG